MLNWDLVQNNDKIVLRFSGELSRNTLLPLWQQRASFLSETKLTQPYIEWDLHDSQQLPNKTVRLVNPPQQLLTLADLVNLSDWIASFTDSH